MDGSFLLPGVRFEGRAPPSRDETDLPDDDEERPTSPDVIAILGFDPASVDDGASDDALAADEIEWEEELHPRDPAGKFAKAGSVLPGLHTVLTEHGFKQHPESPHAIYQHPSGHQVAFGKNISTQTSEHQKWLSQVAWKLYKDYKAHPDKVQFKSGTKGELAAALGKLKEAVPTGSKTQVVPSESEEKPKQKFAEKPSGTQVVHGFKQHPESPHAIYQHPSGPVIPEVHVPNWTTPDEVKQGFINELGMSIAGSEASSQKRFVEKAKRSAAVIMDLQQRYPGLTKNWIMHGGIHVMSPRAFRETKPSDANAVADYGAKYGSIQISDQLSNSSEEIPPKRGSFSVGGSNFNTVLRHEIGHSIQSAVKEAYLKQQGKMLAVAFLEQKQSIPKSVSKYASTNADEWIAESFAAYSSPKYLEGKVRIDPKLQAAFDKVLI